MGSLLDARCWTRCLVSQNSPAKYYFLLFAEKKTCKWHEAKWPVNWQFRIWTHVFLSPKSVLSKYPRLFCWASIYCSFHHSIISFTQNERICFLRSNFTTGVCIGVFKMEQRCFKEQSSSLKYLFPLSNYIYYVPQILEFIQCSWRAKTLN